MGEQVTQEEGRRAAAVYGREKTKKLNVYNRHQDRDYVFRICLTKADMALLC